jgi:hypothetical protein
VVAGAGAEEAPLHDVLDRAQRGDGEAFGVLGGALWLRAV